MKMNVILIFLLINFEFSLVPNWNFEKSTEEQFPSSDSTKDYIIYNSNDYKLVKRLRRDSNGKILSENILTIKNGPEISVPYDNIDNAFYNKLGQEYLVCPRGKYHPTNPYTQETVEPTGFIEGGDWDLHCFEHLNPYYIYLAYFSNGQRNFYGNRNSGGDWENNYVRSEWFADKLNHQNIYNTHH